MSRFSALGTIVKFAIVLVLVVVVQGILAYRFSVFTYFDLPLIVCIYYGFTLGNPTTSVLMGSVVGLMQDSLSGYPLGTNGFSKTLIAFLAASAGAKFNVDQGVTRILAVFLFTIADGLVVTILGLTMGAASGPAFGQRFPTVLVAAIFNALLGLLMFGYRDRFGDATA